MASKFDFNDDALFKEFDLGGDFGDDLDLQPGKVAQAAKAVKDIVSEAAGPMIRTVKHQLSGELYEASELFDEGLEVVSDFKRLKDDLAKEIVPAFNTLKIVTRRVLPKAKNFLPKGIYGKTESYLDRTITTPVREKSDAERKAEYDNASVSDSLSQIFARQNAQASAQALQHTTERTIDQHLDSSRFKVVNQGLSLITGGIGGVGSFLSGTFTDYLKKDIELKYRHLFIARDTYSVAKTALHVLDRKLEEIKHNTGLPDSIKASDPRLKKGKDRSDDYNDYLYGFRRNLMSNIHNDVMDKVKMVTQLGIPMLDTMTQMGGMGFTIPQLIGKGLGWVGSRYVRGKVNTFIDENQSSFDLLRGFTENIKDRFSMRVSNWANRARSSDNPFMYWLASLVPQIVGDTRVKNDLMTNPDAAATFDVATRQSIVEVIPAHLAFIGKHIRGIAEMLAPGANFSDISYNVYKREITSTSQASSDLIFNKLPYAKDIQRTNTDTMNSVRRAALQAHKVGADTEQGKAILENTNNMQEDLLKFFVNSGVRRRFLDIELLTSYLNDPFHMDNDYTNDVLDGIDEPVNFVASLISTITDPETGNIDPMALTTIENAILSYTKKIDISRVAPIISNTYGGARLLREHQLIGQDGNLDMEGVRKFYGKVEGPSKEFYINGTKLTPEEAIERNLTASTTNFDSVVSKDAEIEKKRKELLAALIAKGGDDPRIGMLQSGNPVLIATALAMGEQDGLINKTLMTVGSAGQWLYDKGKAGFDWVSDKLSSGYDTFSKWEADLGFGVDPADEKLKLKSVERLNANRFKCTASSDTRTKTAELHTKHGYAAGKFPDKSVLLPFCKKQKWVIDPDIEILYIDNATSVVEEYDRAYVDDTNFAYGGESTGSSTGSGVIPTYLQYILEAIYIANGKKKLIPKVNIGGFGFRGFGPTPATATASGPSDIPPTSGPSYSPITTPGRSVSIFNIPNETLEHFTSGNVVDNATSVVETVVGTVEEDVVSYTDKLEAYFPSKEGFLNKFADEAVRKQMGDFWDVSVKPKMTFKRFIEAFCMEINASASAKNALFATMRYARTISDPMEREKYVGDNFVRVYDTCKNTVDPNERESLLEKLGRKAGEKFEELKTTTQKKSSGFRDMIKSAWEKFRNSRFYKWVSAHIPPEVKARLKKDFFDAKEGIKKSWDNAMDELSKWADPEGYKKRKLREASEKKFMQEHVVMTEDGEFDPRLQEMIDEANGNAPKEKKPSWWQRTKERLRNARKAYREEREAQKAEKAEAKRKRQEEREQERKLREADRLIDERKERKEIWEDIKDSIKGLFGISKRKEDKEKKEESKGSSNEPTNRVNREAKAAFSDVSFIGPGNNDAFHSDFLTFANASLKLMDAIRVNSGLGVMSFLQSFVTGGFGLIGNLARGAGSMYGGLLRGMGSAAGGLARGVGSVAGGLLKGGLPSALIKAGGSIIGGGLHGWGHAVGGTATGLGYAAGGAANLGKGILGALFGTGSVTAAGVMNFGRRLRRPKFIDIYRKDKIEPGKPLLSAKKQEEGVYFADGSLVRNSMDIKAPVFEVIEGDPNPRTLISDEDIKAGLVDAKGVPLVENTAVFKGQFGGFAGLVANGLGLAAMGIGSLYGKLAELLGITIKKGGEITATVLSRMFGIDTEGTQKYQKQMLSNFALLLELLKSSYYVSYTVEDHEADVKARRRAEDYEDRLDANEQRRNRHRNKNGDLFGTPEENIVGAGEAGANAPGGGSGDGGNGGGITGTIMDWLVPGAAGALTARSLLRNGRNPLYRQTVRTLRNRHRIHRQASRYLDEAIEAERRAAQFGSTTLRGRYYNWRSNRLLEKGARLEQTVGDAAQTARQMGRFPRAKPSRFMKLKRGGKWVIIAAAATWGIYELHQLMSKDGGNDGGLVPLTPEERKLYDGQQKMVDALEKALDAADLSQELKQPLYSRIERLKSILDPAEFGAEYASIKEELTATITKVHGEDYANNLVSGGTDQTAYVKMVSDAYQLEKPKDERTTTTRPIDEPAMDPNTFVVTASHSGQTINVRKVDKNGKETGEIETVKLTPENILHYIGKTGVRSTTREAINNVTNPIEIGATVAPTALPILNKVPILGKGTAFVGKGVPYIDLALTGLGIAEGVTMDADQREALAEKNAHGAFGGGSLFDFSYGSYSHLYDQYQKGFGSGSKQLGLMTLNATLHALDYRQHGQNIGAFAAELTGYCAECIKQAFADDPNIVKTADGTMTRSEFFCKGAINSLDKWNIKSKFGEKFYNTVKAGLEFSFLKMGAPDEIYGQMYTGLTYMSYKSAMVPEVKIDKGQAIIDDLYKCLVGVRCRNQLYTTIYGDGSSLEDAIDHIRKTYEVKAEVTAEIPKPVEFSPTMNPDVAVQTLINNGRAEEEQLARQFNLPRVTAFPLRKDYKSDKQFQGARAAYEDRLNQAYKYVGWFNDGSIYNRLNEYTHYTTNASKTKITGEHPIRASIVNGILAPDPAESEKEYSQRYKAIVRKYGSAITTLEWLAKQPQQGDPKFKQYADEIRKNVPRSYLNEGAKDAYATFSDEPFKGFRDPNKPFVPSQVLLEVGPDGSIKAPKSDTSSTTTNTSAKVTATKSTMVEQAHNVDLAKPVSVAESSIVKDGVSAKTGGTTIAQTTGTDDVKSKVLDDVVTGNRQIIDRLDILAALMRGNINAVINSGDMTRTQFNNGMAMTMDTSVQFTKGAVASLIPRHGPLRPTNPVINMNKPGDISTA